MDGIIKKHANGLWGAKTQGEQYHIYLLAVACLIESRLGDKAFTYGDITRGQCKMAVEIANRYLVDPIDMPDCCYTDRLAHRVSKLPISEGEKLCGYVKLKDKDGNDKHSDFIKRVMDAKLHIEDKNCDDMLEIDKDAEGTYSIWTLFAQVGYAGARNKKVDRYIPIDELRQILKVGLNAFTDVDQLIDEYLEKEVAQKKITLEEVLSSDEKLKEATEQDASEVFSQIMGKKKEELQRMQEEYDISDYEDFRYYQEGDTIHPGLAKSLGNSRKFLDDTLEEPRFAELMAEDAHSRIAWLVKQNAYILLLEEI